MKAQYMFCELWEAENSDYRLQSKNTVAAKKKKGLEIVQRILFYSNTVTRLMAFSRV